MRLRKFLLLAVCCVLALAPAAGADEPVRLGVARFLSRADGVSEQQAAAVGDIFARMLTNSRTIAVLERDRLDAIAAEHRLGVAGVLDPGTAAAVGRIVGCQYMLLGSVTNLAKKSSTTDLWLFSNTKEAATATVDARVVDVETSEVVLSMSETGTSSQKGSGFNFYGISTAKAELSGMEERAIEVATSNLGFRIREALTGECAEVIGIDGKSVTLNVGRTSGVDRGSLYRIYAGGHTLGQRTHTLAVVRVTDAQNDLSIASVEKNGGNVVLIRRGDKVGPIAPAEAQDLIRRKAFPKERPRGIQSGTGGMGGLAAARPRRSGGATAPAAPRAAAPSSAAPSEAPENTSTDPAKIIPAYGLPAGEANTRRIMHLGAANLQDKRQAYEKYVELANSYSGDYLAAYRAGVLAQEMGRKDDAARWLDKALSINPDYAPAKKARAGS